MPFYPQLKITSRDSAKTKNKKKRVVANLDKLRNALQDHIQSSRKKEFNGKTAKIATWNLREFGKSNYGGRSYEELYYIAEIIACFDLVSLQEIRSDLSELKKLMRLLGPSWDYIATDVTDGRAGNGERMVFLFNCNTAKFKHIAGELTLEENQKVRAAFGERIQLENGFKLDLTGFPNMSGTYKAATTSKTKAGVKTFKLREDLELPLPAGTTLQIPDGACLTLKKGTVIEKPATGRAKVNIPKRLVHGEDYALRFPNGSFDDSHRQFARTPFLISFQLGWLKLNLCTVHIFYGDASLESKLNQRRDEIQLLTDALAKKAKAEFQQDHESFLCVLGDFNIIAKDHPTMEALESNDFKVPEELKSIPGSNVKRDMAYDQIAFWQPSNRITKYSKLEVVGANVFDFFEHVFTKDDEDEYRKEGVSRNGLKPTSSYNTWRTYKMSDHLPMWVEVRNDFSDEYLEHIEKQNDD